MSKQSNAISTKVEIDNTITKNDIVTMKVAEIELNLKKQLELKRQEKILQREKIKGLQDGRSRLINGFGEDYFGDKVSDLIEVLRGWGEEVTPSYNMESQSGQYTNICVRIAGHKLEAKLKARDRQKLVGIDNDLTVAHDTLEDLNEQSLELKRQEKQLPSFERQVSAALTKATVERAGSDINELVAELGGVELPGLTCLE